MRYAEAEQMPAIIATGSKLPDHVRGSDEVARLINEHPSTEREISPALIDRLGRKTGVKERRVVTPGEQTSSMLGAEALRHALTMAEINPSDLKALMTATSSPDYISVPASALIQNELGIPNNVRSLDIGGNACSGFLQAVQSSFESLQARIGKGGPQAVIGVEVLTPIVKKPDTIVLFGDGAGAVITDLVTPDEGAPRNMGFAGGSDGAHATDLYIPGGGSKFFTTKETLEQGLHELHMDGDSVLNNAIARMAEMSKAALQEAGLDIKDVTHFIPHQANLQIMKGVADALGIPLEKVRISIDHTGNNSAGTLGITLDESVRSGIVQRNDIVLFAVFGAGFQFTAGVVPMVGLPKHPR